MSRAKAAMSAEERERFDDYSKRGTRELAGMLIELEASLQARRKLEGARLRAEKAKAKRKMADEPEMVEVAAFRYGSRGGEPVIDLLAEGVAFVRFRVRGEDGQVRTVDVETKVRDGYPGLLVRGLAALMVRPLVTNTVVVEPVGNE